MAWGCGACGEANEDHALFCATCARRRSQVGRLGWTFALSWAAAVAVGQTVGCTGGALFHQALFPDRRMGVVMRIVHVILEAAVVAGAQLWVLARSAPGRRLVAWVPMTCGAAALCGLLFTLYSWCRNERYLSWSAPWIGIVHGAAYGALVGSAQLLILDRRLPGPRWWIYLVSNVMAFAAVHACWDLLPIPGALHRLPTELLYLWKAMVAGILAGSILAMGMTPLLRRALREPSHTRAS